MTKKEITEKFKKFNRSRDLENVWPYLRDTASTIEVAQDAFLKYARKSGVWRDITDDEIRKILC